MFKVNMLPARYGDSLWIEYGREANPHRLLIDGGLATTYEMLRTRLRQLLSSQRHFDLIVVSHVDADHIEGLIPIMADTNLEFHTDDFWFNAWRHLSPAPRSLLGPVEGEYLSGLIKERRFCWNQAFGEEPVIISGVELPEFNLDGGMRLTLLSPDAKSLLKLKPIWKRTVQNAGLDPGNLPAGRQRLYETPRLLPASLLGDHGPDLETLSQTESKMDNSVANGSSIAFLAEYEGKSCLFAGDAKPELLTSSLQRLLNQRNHERLTLDAFKVPHHGGSKNLTKDLVELVDCRKYLFSSNGERYGHPDKETVARVLVGKSAACELLFNYRSEANDAWEDPNLKSQYDYCAEYPPDNEHGLEVAL